MTEKASPVLEVQLIAPFLTREEHGRPLGEAAGQPLRVGDGCPRCDAGRLRLDGLLNLTCSQCSFTQAGCFT